MRVLISAASKHGSTAEIAEAIAARLAESGLETSVLAPDSVGSIRDFDAAVIGSAVYGGHWMASAREMAERHGGDLTAIPVWLFSSGPVGDPPKPEEDPVDVAAIVEQTGAREHRVFSGRIDRDSLGFAEKAIVRALRAPTGDFRDWPEVSGWAGSIAESLTSSKTVG